MVMSVSRCSLYDDVLQVHAYIYIYTYMLIIVSHTLIQSLLDIFSMQELIWTRHNY